MELVIQPLEEIRAFELLGQLFGAGFLAVVADVHAGGIVDNDGEIALLRQNGGDIQDRPKENECKDSECNGSQGYQPRRPLVSRATL